MPDTPPDSLREGSSKWTRRSLLGAMAAAGALSFPVREVAAQAESGSAAGTVTAVPLSRRFGNWAAALDYDDLPADVIDRAKGVTLQALVSILLGSRTDAGRQAVALVVDEEAGVRRGATVLVDGSTVTVGGAVFANAEMALAGGKWDTFRMLTHPGTGIVPAALAAAEMSAASGRDFIAGIVAGYEVMERMAAEHVPTVMARGFHAGPVFGIFGAAVAAARVLGLSADQITAAIGLCVNLAGGNLQSSGLREGAAVRNAMLAVSLARRGAAGRETALEGPAGFYHAFAGNNDGQLSHSFTGTLKTELSRIADGLGNEWMFLQTLYRIYSIPGYNIAHIELTARLCEQHDIRPEDVERVEAIVNWMETQYPSPAFATVREDLPGPVRRGSTRYYAAYGIVARGFPLLPDVPEPPGVMELAERVTIIPAHERPLFGPRVTITLKDGRQFTADGTGREFIWDFQEQVRRIGGVAPGLPVDETRFAELIEAVRELEALTRADRLTQLTLAEPG
ncbi:MAG TPA: MmgE/PrpD family protein [Gammaproteobacteria bacterium]|nr:MmgE/PrpD family protein [Gammaproteobacteria bacterium]